MKANQFCQKLNPQASLVMPKNLALYQAMVNLTNSTGNKFTDNMSSGGIWVIFIFKIHKNDFLII